MPTWLGFHKELVFVSGVIEIVLALLLLIPSIRSIVAWGIIILLIAVFPANVQMLLNYIKNNNPYTWIAIFRLPIQIILIWWAYRFTKSSNHSTYSRISAG
jgi:uncharacterized membrane protein